MRLSLWRFSAALAVAVALAVGVLEVRPAFSQAVPRLISNSQLAPAAATTIKGNATGSSASPTDLLGYQVRDTFATQGVRVNPTQGQTVAINHQAQGAYQIVVPNAITAWTAGAPSNPADMATLVFIIRNNSGGAITTTWDSSASGYRLVGGTWTDPATGKSRSIGFMFLNTLGVWVEQWRSSGDI